MSGSLKRLYWDTSVFLCFLSEEEHERRRICEDILQHARDGQLELITSMYTIVEVIRPKGIKHPVPLTDDQAALLDGMFKWSWIKKIQVHEELARFAVKLSRKYGLKPADSIHAATAIEEAADELQVWDRDYAKVAKLITVSSPQFLSTQLKMNFAPAVGPTPDDFKEAHPRPVSNTPLETSRRPSRGDAEPSAPPPEHSPSE